MKRVIIIAGCLFYMHFSYGSSLYFYEIGTEDTALAGAGQAARGQDASTIVTNPAGMTLLPDHMVTGGLQALGGDVNYELSHSKYRSPGNVMNVMPNGSFFYTQKVTDKAFAGIGVYGNYGLGIDFGDWAGSRLIKSSTMGAATLSPSFAYALNERLSIGGSANINYGFLSLTREVNGTDEKEKDHDWALSFRTGLLFLLTEQTRFGVTWTSKSDYDFHVNTQAKFANFPDVTYELPVSAQVSAPQQVMLSMVHDINRRWSIMADLGWQDWSEFGAPQVIVNDKVIDQSNRMKDTWHSALGLQYRPTVDWRFNTGIAFDSTPYRDQNDVSLTLPTGDEWRFGAGAQYQMTPASNIGFAAEYLKMQSSYAQSPRLLQGSYEDPYLWFISINYSYMF